MAKEPPEPGVHDVAARGFGAAADTYARGRPDYPPALDGWLRDVVGLHAGSRVIDLGAGTGRFVPRLRAVGADVTAIEPVAAMRDQLAKAHPSVTALAGSAQAIPCSDASVDAVVCAQAFHWFASPAALDEIHRVLVPGGVLALVWNVRDESVPWVARLTAIANRYEGDAPRYHTGAWRRVFPARGFTALAEAGFDHVHDGPPSQVIVDRFLSVSFIAALDAESRLAVRAELEALIANEPALAGRATAAYPYRTAAFHCRRT